MQNPPIFKDLPETFPEVDQHKVPAAVSSVVFHIGVLGVLIVVPLLITPHADPWQLMVLLAPVAPPPPPAPVQLKAPSEPAAPERQLTIRVAPGTMVTPTEIPKDIALIVDEPQVPDVAAVAGFAGGSDSAALRSILLTNVRLAEVAALPPPPPPPPPALAPSLMPAGPIRVGGNIREPRIVKSMPPVYPKLAIKARVRGTVVLEATLMADGTVDEIRVISGHPLLIQAAIDCVKEWRYEPTYLNGEPVSVILKAGVNFDLTF